MMQFIASRHLSCGQAGLAALDWIHFVMEMAQAACPGRPRVKLQELLLDMARKAVAKAFTAAADTRFDGAVNPFHNPRLVAIILDAVTTWGHQFLPVPTANALQRSVQPMLVHLRGDAAGAL
jgi:hypothetical protein